MFSADTARYFRWNSPFAFLSMLDGKQQLRWFVTEPRNFSQYRGQQEKQDPLSHLQGLRQTVRTRRLNYFRVNLDSDMGVLVIQDRPWFRGALCEIHDHAPAHWRKFRPRQDRGRRVATLKPAGTRGNVPPWFANILVFFFVCLW